MNRSSKWITGSLACMIALLAVTGCSDGKKAKEQALEALNKQAEVRNYTFEGHAALQASETFVSSDPNPLTAAFLRSLTSADLDWSGIADAANARLEAKLKITPKGGAALPEIPILFKDNKLYMQIPLLNPKNEFFSIDMKSQSSLMAQSPQAFAKMTALLVEDLDPKWFQKEKGNDAGAAAWYAVTVKPSNVKQVADLLQVKLPAWAKAMQSDGLLTQGQLESVIATLNRKKVVLQQPGSIRLSVAKEGFVQELQVDLRYVLQENNLVSPVQSLILDNKWGAINQSVPFTRDIPAQAKPFEDILNPIKK